MLVGIIAGEDYLFAESAHFVFLRILRVDAFGRIGFDSGQVADAGEFLRGLDIVGILVEQQPAAEVVEPVTLEAELYGAFATYFTDEQFKRSGIFCIYRIDTNK